MLLATITTALFAVAAQASACRPTLSCTLNRVNNGVVCAQNGHATGAGQPFPVDNSVSLNDCASFCANRASCQTIYYDGGSCTLYDNSIQGYTFSGSSDGDWYDLHCFTCSVPPICTDPRGCGQNR
ncbi:hypothetical protein BGZ63DRAFT_393937 [Mariannaea sp. PMI_226]|nr:hypothetical protein BGZ63DRAFT_393937 [Mariannaea sp. PMI_226]